MKKYLLIILPLLILYISGCSDDNNNVEEEELDAPVLVSSTPSDGASGISKGELTIILTFDQNVTSPSSTHSSVTLNNSSVNSINANLKEVKIEVSGLVESTTYDLVIPKGTILGPTKVEAQEIRISFTTKEAVILNITSSVVTENPLSQAQNVYDFLLENYGEKILSATMANVNWNINEAEWVKFHTGKYPAITTFDYVHLPASPANWIDYSDITVVEDWWNNNGIASAGWHWIVPRYEGDTEVNSYTYKPSETTFDASDALIEGTWENSVIKADLEKIADYILLLQNKNIPIIWRPIHEAAGNIYEYNDGTAWFWWGNDGAETYKSLWIYMFNYFKNKGINNLIWVWTTQTKDNDFYPGDEYVDIVGRDIYGNESGTSIAEEFNSIQETYPNKMISLSECGTVAEISEQWTSGARWSFFMPWYDYDRTLYTSGSEFEKTEHGHAPASWWVDAVNQDYVITRDEMPDLK